MSRGTNKVTTYVNTGKTAIFISGTTSDKFPDIEITVGNQSGATSGRLEDPLVVKVTDGNNRPFLGVAVAFASTQKRKYVYTCALVQAYILTTTDVELVDEDLTDRT